MKHEATKSVRLCVVGGFLGAGKTTALLRLARAYSNEGLRVGLITNDQAPGLVDTGTLRVRGFRVEEIAGACFCCKFDDLAQAAERMRIEDRPDVLLGEPVGSCTDLAATVVAPFRKLYGEHYSVAPYSVLVDPVRVRQIVLDRGFGGFSAKVAYIFQKQIEEADIVCINKCDLLDASDRMRLLKALEREFPRAQVLLVSALTGEGFDAWRSLLEASPERANIVPVDYDVYAEGEAELGWLNMTFDLSSEKPFDPNALALELLERLAAQVAETGAEIAHMKALVQADGAAAIANAVGAGTSPVLALGLKTYLTSGELVLNARVHLDPEDLRVLASEALEEVLALHGVSASMRQASHFRPGRPVPTHRFAQSLA